MAVVVNTDPSIKKECARGDLCINPLGKLLPATNDFFSKKKNGKYGLNSVCKSCRSLLENTPARRIRTKEYRTTDRYKEFIKRHRQKPETIAARMAYRSTGKGKKVDEEYRKTENYKLSQAKYRNSDRYKTVQRVARERRLTRIKNLPDNFSITDWQWVLEIFGYKCAVCKREDSQDVMLVMDHLIPLSSSNCPGTVPGNIIPLCHTRKGAAGAKGCNLSKSNKDFSEWVYSKFDPDEAKDIIDLITMYVGLFNEGFSMNTWMQMLDSRQQKQVEWSKLYVKRFSHGDDGHVSKTTIAKLAEMLDFIQWIVDGGATDSEKVQAIKEFLGQE